MIKKKSDSLNSIYSNIQEFLVECSTEIDKYCQENNWVNEIKAYINKWSPKLVLEWKTGGTFEIDEQLNKIRNWIENIKNGMEKIIITQNKLLKIDTMPIENLLVSKLDAIYIEICECVLKEINKDSLSFISAISKTLKVKNIAISLIYSKL